VDAVFLQGRLLHQEARFGAVLLMTFVSRLMEVSNRPDHESGHQELECMAGDSPFQMRFDSLNPSWSLTLWTGMHMWGIPTASRLRISLVHHCLFFGTPLSIVWYTTVYSLVHHCLFVYSLVHHCLFVYSLVHNCLLLGTPLSM
jgi:hypothetical protein